VALLEREGSSLDHDFETEALFKEARRRRRRRCLIWFGVVLLFVGAASGGYVATRRTPIAPRRAPTHPHRPPVAAHAPTAPVVPRGIDPEHPYGLAVAPDGTLYLIDTGRDEILELLRSGGFQVAAGNGERGFSGDGGPATDAAINLEPNSAVVVARNGAMYFSDSGNGRVREVEPDGTIETIAGGGSVALGTGSAPALQASFGAEGPAGLAIGPDGGLYIGAAAVYQLAGDDALQWVVGEPENTPTPPGWQGVYANPAIEQDFSPAVRLAFDAQGDLLIAGGGGLGLYEDSTSGRLLFLENFRGDGAWGSMATMPDGDVILSARNGLSLFQPSGTITAIPNHLSALLGPMHGSAPSNTFIGGDGVAVAPNGQVYVDTNTGNGFTSVTALVETGTYGSPPRVLWRS
jgi:hypothetical protein